MNIAKTVRSLFVLGAITALSVFATSASAASHVISFGEGGQFTYVPSQLTVAVGDTVIWSGAFSMHPLRFTSVPVGVSKPSDVTSGAQFTYVLLAEGTYNYDCIFHASSGMIGSITAVAASVDRAEDIAMLRLSANPISFDSPLTIELGFDGSLIEQLNICNMRGSCMMYEPGGGYQGSTVTLSHIASVAGTYVLAIFTSDGKSYRRKLVVVQ